MKLALCYESMMPAKGGCETYIADLVRRLAQDHHEVHLFASNYDPTSFPESVIHHLVPPSSGPRFLRPWQFSKACQAALQQYQFDVSVGFIKTWGQDVLMPQGGLFAASAEHNVLKHRSAWKRALVRVFHALDPKHWSYRRLERKQLFDFDSTIVVPSRMVQRHLVEHYDLSGPRIKVVHNAIDVKRFQAHDRLLVRSQTRERWQLKPDDVVGLFVGHNYRLKGLDPLLRAIRLIPKDVNFRLMICGGKRYQPFQRLAESLGILDRVRFLGYVAEVREPFFAADFLVHPSFYDPCALVTMEALACGLPVITTKLNGGSELLTGPLAALTIETPHHHQAMADRIIHLCQPQHRSQCSRAAREAANLWTFEHHYQALLQIFAEVRQRKHPELIKTLPRPGLVS